MNGQRLFVGAAIATVLALGTISGAAMQTTTPAPASGPWNCEPWSRAGGMMPGDHQGRGMMGGDQGDWSACGGNGMGPGMMGQGMMGPGMMGG